ncbi:hypothetical protein KI387_032666 [Taxus chinensis]|uniref:Uncharacterized protein n=1 Tax=Taxus chinensis TaxID=29808 RepID=A0AA38F083_TAXCH|nr:hypothetical protein KI387_032666 [Taxus chinensis]
MFDIFIKCCNISRELEYEEFWEEVYRAYDKSRNTILFQGNPQRTDARTLLAKKGWVDLTYYSKYKKRNPIFKQMKQFVQDAVETCKTHGREAEFGMGLLFMQPQWKRHLYHACANPQRHIRMFVLLPPQGKDWVLCERGRNIPDKVLFLAIHFPTIFPIDGDMNEFGEEIMKQFVQDAVETCKTHGREAEFGMGLLFMQPQWKRHLYHACANPQRHIRMFVLLPPQGKDWVLCERGRNMPDKVLFLAIHFPTIFPIDGYMNEFGEEIVRVICDVHKRIKEHFMAEICETRECLQRVAFAFPPIGMDEAAEEIDVYLDDKWSRLNKLYFSFLRESPEFLPDYGRLLLEYGKDGVLCLGS